MNNLKMILYFALFFTPLISNAVPNKIEGLDLVSEKNLELSLSAPQTIVIFMSSKCPCSNSHIEHIKSLKTTFSDMQFVGVMSNYDESKEQGQIYFQNMKMNFPVIYDPEGKIADAFGALKTPHAFVFNSSGNILYQGGVSSSHDFPRAKKHILKNALQSLKEHQPIAEPEGRTLGCSITRKSGNPWQD